MAIFLNFFFITFGANIMLSAYDNVLQKYAL